MSISITRFLARIIIIIMLAFSITHCRPLASRVEMPTETTLFSGNVIQEVSSVIVNFETLWLSEQSHRDPAFQAELATGEYLDHMGYANSNIQSEVEWLVTDAAKLEILQLIEYNHQRFKAEACVITSGRKIRSNGGFISVFSGIRVCGVYVFVRTDGKWKLLGFLNDMDPRNYEYAPGWLKDVIGEPLQK